MPRTRRPWPRAVRWTLIILMGLVFVVVCALAIGAWWLEHKTLKQEFRFGENKASSVRVYGGTISWWALRIEADSVWYRSPLLDARVGALNVDADLLAGITTFMPAAKIAADSAYLRVRSDTAPKEKTPLDSIAFPDFKIPVALTVKVRHVAVEDDSGILARVDTISASNRGGRKAAVRARGVRTRWTKRIGFNAWAYADWSVRDSVDFRAGVRRGEDYVRVKGRHAKSPLWHGRDAVDAVVDETAPYARAILGKQAGDSLPQASNLRVTASARLSEEPALSLELDGNLSAYRLSKDFTLSPQTVALDASWKDEAGNEGSGTLRLQSRGQGGEDILVQAQGRVLPGFNKRVRTDSLQDSVPLWTRLEYAAVSLSGHARGFRVRVQDTVRTANLEIEKADWNGSRLAVALQTGDSSRIEASGRRQPRERWSAAFDVDVAPQEQWLRIFLGDKVAFDALQLEGTAEGSMSGKQPPTVKAMLAARKVVAYEVSLDSIRTYHEYGPQGYVLKPSRLYSRKKDKRTEWTLGGSAEISTPALAFELSSPGHGTLRYAQDASGTMEARATLFDVAALPYAILDSLPIQQPVLDGIFVWNPDRKSGRVDLAGQGKVKKENLELFLKGVWDSRRMNLERASAKMGGSEINIGARLRLNGRQFWEAYEVKPGQYEYVSIQTPGFDIAKMMALFQPEPALSKGSVEGMISYGDSSGFEGRLNFKEITPREAVGDIVLKDLSLEGNGDTLFVAARTTSASIKPLNAQLRVGVSALLQEEQRVTADLVAGETGAGDKNLRLRLEATTRRFQSFKGTLTGQGSAELPEKSGTVERIELAMDFDVPLVDPMNRATMSTRKFGGVYILPGLAQQTFSLDPTLRGGVFRIPRFSIRNEQGQAVSGNLEYSLSTGSLKAHVDGERFAAAWGDDYKLDVRNLNFDFSQDAKGMRVGGRFSSASFLFVDAPLHARGTLTSVNVAYDQPKGARGTGTARQRRENAPSTLTLSGNLSESMVRYRLKSFADLQKVFRKERKTRSTDPIRLNVKVQTLGNDNVIDSDLLRLTWVGNLTIRGVHPYTLFNGRINALNGGLGLDKQAYDMQRLEVKWLNAPLEEGVVNMEARKELAANCMRRNDADVDSCTVITRLNGELNEMRFSYDSDCGGSYGAGASVAAILYSVQRGCYDNSLATGEGGDYGGKALTLLEPTLNRGLTGIFGRYSANWIEAAEVSGLGSLSGEDEGSGDTLGEALSLGLTSKEYKRLRLRLRSGYHTASQDLSNPWEHMVALEWRPPAEYLVNSPSWKRRLNENLRAVASLQTRPERADDPEEDEIEKKLSLVYSYVFWGSWWNKPRKREEVNKPSTVKPAQTTEEVVE